MPAQERRLILANIDRDGYTNDIDCYLRNDGYKMLKKALGMKGPDIVTEVKSKPIHSPSDLILAVTSTPVGSKIPLTLIRSGKTMKVEVEVGARPSPEKLSQR